MPHRFAFLIATVACVLACAVTASAGLPKKNAVYQGTIKSSPFQMTVLLGVAPNGKKLHFFTYKCGTGSGTTTVFGIPIDSTGHFKWTKMSGSVVTWKMAGHFVSPTKAFVSINSIDCGGSKGSTTLTLKQ
jgi:hypothetical protein